MMQYMTSDSNTILGLTYDFYAFVNSLIELCANRWKNNVVPNLTIK